MSGDEFIHLPMTPQPWDLISLLKQKIAEKGGGVCGHAHFDKAYVITPEMLAQTEAHMEVKWDLWKNLKENYTHDDLVTRISRAVEKMISQGITLCRTNIDVDNTVGLKCVEAALEVKEKYKDKIELQLVSQVLEGALTPESRAWIEKAAPLVDVLGGLPSRERPRQAEHLDVIFEMAKKYNKHVDVHIDQNNDPDEKDTELLAKKVIEHGLQGKVNAVHACSLAAQEDGYMKEVIAMIKEADMSVIVSPRAMLDGVQMRDKTAPLHNSIAPVPQLVAGGVNVALGVDNIHDLFCPYIDGDLFTDLLFLIETTRFYDIDKLVDIATVNGRKALKLN
jgi:cytosine/adenosine deaminase-related metal-dependent hydrolase